MPTSDMLSRNANSERAEVDLEDALAQAVGLHGSGRLSQAEDLYREVLQQDPNHPDALHLLGILVNRKGDPPGAIELITKAIHSDGANPVYQNSLGTILHASGRLDEAIEHYRQALELRPDLAEVHYNLGWALQQQGRLQAALAAYRQVLKADPDHLGAHRRLAVALEGEGHIEAAIDHYRRALSLDPNDPELHQKLADRLHAEGRSAEAAEHYRRALDVDPESARAHNNFANTLKRLGRLDDAREHYLRALSLDPSLAETHTNLGGVLGMQGRLDLAITHYRQALDLRPDLAQAHYGLGEVLREQGELKSASLHFREALSLEPDHAGACVNLGFILQSQDKVEEAVAYCRRALDLRPDLAEAHQCLGNAYESRGRLTPAEQHYRAALGLAPELAAALRNLGVVLVRGGRVEEGVEYYRRAIELRPNDAHSHSGLISALNYHPSMDPAAIHAEHRRWAQRHAASLAAEPFPHDNDPNPVRRLRIGYVSPDFCRHSVSYFFEPILAAHDRGGFLAYCYANVSSPDETTARLRDLADGWRDIRGMTDEEAAEQIRRDRIDILVDLSGHTADSRILLFARKPAPVQMTYLGYTNTTGLGTVDYRLTDARADPPGQTDHLYTEQLLRLDGGFLCYRPHPESPAVMTLPALRSGRVSFGSFNNLAKLSPTVIALWSQILSRVPSARLVLKARALTDEGVRERTLTQFARQGVAPERLTLMEPAAEPRRHLSLYREIDIGLDPFPYNGTATTCEALWMGVPVISMEGRTHAARVGVSLLSSVGLTELVADSPQAYVDKAVTLASDRDALRRLRGGLRDRLRHSALLDAAHFTHSLEATYRRAWKRWCEAAKRRA